jgi:hypothetical protein
MLHKYYINRQVGTQKGEKSLELIKEKIWGGKR